MNYTELAKRFKFLIAKRLKSERSFDVDNISNVTAWLNSLVSDENEARRFFGDSQPDSDILGDWYEDTPLTVVAYLESEPHLADADVLMSPDWMNR